MASSRRRETRDLDSRIQDILSNRALRQQAGETSETRGQANAAAKSASEKAAEIADRIAKRRSGTHSKVSVGKPHGPEEARGVGNGTKTAPSNVTTEENEDESTSSRKPMAAEFEESSAQDTIPNGGPVTVALPVELEIPFHRPDIEEPTKKGGRADEIVASVPLGTEVSEQKLSNEPVALPIPVVLDLPDALKETIEQPRGESQSSGERKSLAARAPFVLKTEEVPANEKPKSSAPVELALPVELAIPSVAGVSAAMPTQKIVEDAVESPSEKQQPGENASEILEHGDGPAVALPIPGAVLAVSKASPASANTVAQKISQTTSAVPTKPTGSPFTREKVEGIVGGVAAVAAGMSGAPNVAGAISLAKDISRTSAHLLDERKKKRHAEIDRHTRDGFDPNTPDPHPGQDMGPSPSGKSSKISDRIMGVLAETMNRSKGRVQQGPMDEYEQSVLSLDDEELLLLNSSLSARASVRWGDRVEGRGAKNVFRARFETGARVHFGMVDDLGCYVPEASALLEHEAFPTTERELRRQHEETMAKRKAREILAAVALQEAHKQKRLIAAGWRPEYEVEVDTAGGPAAVRSTKSVLSVPHYTAGPGIFMVWDSLYEEHELPPSTGPEGI